ncbi:unnamed protein product, partial [Polarella glacialis]
MIRLRFPGVLLRRACRIAQGRHTSTSLVQKRRRLRRALKILRRTARKTRPSPVA